jgi:hypothetical protein
MGYESHETGLGAAFYSQSVVGDSCGSQRMSEAKRSEAKRDETRRDETRRDERPFRLSQLSRTSRTVLKTAVTEVGSDQVVHAERCYLELARLRSRLGRAGSLGLSEI